MTAPLKLLLAAHHHGPILPLGLGYLAAYLRQQDLPVEIIIELAPKLSLDLLTKHDPDIIGLSTVTRDYNKTVEFAKLAKARSSTPIIIGGHHISPIPETLPECFDAAVIGEGERTLAQLINDFSEDRNLDRDMLSHIPGLAWHDRHGNVVVNLERERINPLDVLPHPARDLFDMAQATAPTYDWSFIDRMSMTSISTSRGCPYDCIYCSSAAFWKDYRMFSAEYVAAEITEIVEAFKVDAIMIVDDLFTASKPRLRRLVEILEDSGITGRVKFWVNARANILDEEVAGLLKRMNTFHVGLGFESFSEPVLRRLKKDTVTVEQNRRAFSIAKQSGFDVEGCFIVGSPEEGREDMELTYEFIKSNPIDSFGVQVMTPLPGTQIWQEAKARSIVDDHMDFDDLFDFNPVNYIENFNKYERFLLTDKVAPHEFLDIYRRFQSLQFLKGRYSKLRLRDLTNKRFWQRLVEEPSLLWRSIKFSLAGRVFKHPRLWKFYQRMKKKLTVGS